MAMNLNLKLKLERWRIKAELFLENNIDCFIKTLDDGWYSGKILFVGENYITIYDIIKKENFRIYWLDVVLFKELEEKR